MAALSKHHLSALRPESTVTRAESAASISRAYLVGPASRKDVGYAASNFASLPHETEDVRITGGTRSLVRRLLALNVEGTLSGSKMRSLPVASLRTRKLA